MAAWKRSNQSSLLLWATVAALLFQNLAIPVISAATVEDQKTYYHRPDPNVGTPPTGSSSHSPPKSSGGGHGHGHGHGTPSNGGGSYGGTPPVNCGNPPSGGGHATPTPSTPSGGGGGYHYDPPTTTPTTPTPTIPTPSTPSGGGGGYHYAPPTYQYAPPTYQYAPPTTTPTTPTPTIPTPTTPIITPPTTPISTPTTPTIPGITIPSPPFDPNSPPFSCNYWRNHPTLVWGLIGWFGTVGGTLGATSNIPGFGSNMNLMDALSNSRTDGYGALYREGTAAFLNSMVHSSSFPYSTQQVRDRFLSSMSSNKAAANQAQLFKLANEGRVKA